MGFRFELENLKHRFTESVVDGQIDVKEILPLAADCCDVLGALFRGISDSDEKLNELAADLEALVNQYLVPIDLTKYKVPAIVEQLLFDPQLPLAVRPLLISLRGRLAK